VRGLNRDQIVKIVRFTGCENFVVRERSPNYKTTKFHVCVSRRLQQNRANKIVTDSVKQTNPAITENNMSFRYQINT